MVTQLPRCNQVCIDDFQDKADLINVAMASAHVPMFLDWKVRAEAVGRGGWAGGPWQQQSVETLASG